MSYPEKITGATAATASKLTESCVKSWPYPKHGQRNKKYKVIYADPPWQYDNERTGGSLKSGARTKYPVLTMSAIQQLPVETIVDKDALLFLWITWPMIDHVREIMQAWGFRYYGLAFDWLKINQKSPGFAFGMGFFTRGNSEVCLLGMRGNYNKKTLKSRSVSSVIVWPRGEHSAKPPIVRQKIDELVGDKVNKIELFARGPPAMGWDAWGRDVVNMKLEDLITKPAPKKWYVGKKTRVDQPVPASALTPRRRK